MAIQLSSKMKRYRILALIVTMLISCSFMCTKYTYPLVEDGKATSTQDGQGVVLAKASSEEEAEVKTAQALETVSDIDLPVKNEWQDRIIGIALAVGTIMIIMGIVMAIYGGHMIKGLLLAGSGATCLICFIVLYGVMIWIQNNSGLIVGGFCTVLVAALGYYGYHNKGTIRSLITSFETQKDKVWGDGTEQQVKEAQGRFQDYIAKQRKSLLKNKPNESIT